MEDVFIGMKKFDSYLLKITWKKLKMEFFSSLQHATEVLNTFKSYKVDVISGKKKKEDWEKVEEGGSDKFFAKYLTNQNLLQLQLSDSNFRRYVLVQFLILFQYLKSTVKFKSEAHVLSDDQTKWIDKTEVKIYDLLGETPPFGKKFGESVKHILEREIQWNIWKNQGCPSLTPKVDANEAKEKKSETNGDKGTFLKNVINFVSFSNSIFKRSGQSPSASTSYQSCFVAFILIILVSFLPI